MPSSMKDLLGGNEPYWAYYPAQRHSPTSVAAAESIRDKIGPLHARILAYLRERPEGATDEQMQTHLNMRPNTQRPRRIELQAMGKVIDSGQTRRTESGRSAVIWRVAQ